MSANPKDILIWVSLRQVLATYARACSNLEPHEFVRLKLALLEEVEKIEPNHCSTEIWRQATQAMVTPIKDTTIAGMAAYGLERLGLWPGQEKSPWANA